MALADTAPRFNPLRILIQSIGGEEKSETFHSIDALRGIAALTVLIYHYKLFFSGTPEKTVLLSQVKNTPLFRILTPILEHGMIAVMLFWIISGFVFMHVYADRRRNISGRRYAVHRFSRLYPLHFATLMIVAALQFISLHAFGNGQIFGNQDVKHFALQIVMASNWGFEDGLSYNGPIWSVSAEIAIYVAFFAFLKFVRPTLLSTGLAMISFAALFFSTGSLISLCGLYFFAGTLCYGLFRLGDDRTPVLGMMTALVVAGAAVLIPGPQTIALIGGFGGLMTALAFLERAAPSLPFAFLQPLGDLSYSVYLLHCPVQIAFLMLVAAGAIPFGVVASPVFAICYFVFVCLLARIVFLRFERPAQRWLRQRLGG
jgi:peptidoglycan/LPS O-acetylase OafA/YrhL